MAPITFTKRERRILLVLKSMYALMWGFINGVTFLVASRYATMMTGNLLLLAKEVKEWRVDEMLVTLSFIGAYVVAGAMYDALNILVKNKTLVLGIAMGGVLASGVLADVLSYILKSCSPGTDKCDGMHLYFLTPVAFLTGIVANGYCGAHPDGVTSTLMTGHMKTLPNTLVKLYLPKEEDRPRGPGRVVLVEKARLSCAMIAAFFLGAVLSFFAEDAASVKGFTPVFTVFSALMASLCVCHSKMCEWFFRFHEQQSRAMEKMARASILVPGNDPLKRHLMQDVQTNLSDESEDDPAKV